MKLKTATNDIMPDDQYHKLPAIGASMLEDLRSSRRLYQDKYVMGNYVHTSSDAMVLGKMIHARVLEPEKYESMLAPPPPDFGPDGKKWLRRKGSEHETAWNAYMESVKDLIPATNADRTIVERIADRLTHHKRARRILEGKGSPEFSIFWDDKNTGLRCKCRVDWMADFPVDIKTTADPSPQAFSRVVQKFGYHRKASHYRAGIAAYTGEELPMLHLVVGTVAPYQVAVYEIDDRTEPTSNIHLGDVQRKTMMEELKHCLDTGDWSDPWERDVNTLPLPRWAYTEDEYR